MPNRNRYFDLLRGIAILMVIGIHAYNPPVVIATGLDIGILARQTLNAAVPLFLAISGFFLYSKPLNTKGEIFSFWKKQIPKNYIPVVIWSLPYFVLDILGEKGMLVSTLKLIVCGYSIYYFVALIIQYYLLLPVLQRVKNVWGGIVALSLISIMVVTYFNIVNGMGLPLILYAGCFALWVVFYYLGCRLSVSDRSYSLGIPLAITLFGFILSFGESMYLVSKYGTGYGIKLSAFIYSFGLIMLLMSKKLEVDYRPGGISWLVEWMGRNSFFIYLFHCYIVVVLNKIPLDLSWLTRWIIIIIVSLLVAKALKYLPYRIRYYIGSYD